MKLDLKIDEEPVVVEAPVVADPKTATKAGDVNH